MIRNIIALVCGISIILLVCILSLPTNIWFLKFILYIGIFFFIVILYIGLYLGITIYNENRTKTDTQKQK
jgi:hypothetical protein